MTSGTQAEAGFQQVYQYGQTGLVSLLESAFVGTVTFHSGDSNFNVVGPALYGGPGDQNHDVHVIARSSSELLDTAQSGSLAARKSLEALSPFEVSGGIAPTPDPSLADLDSEYLIARAGMLEARLAYLDAGEAPGPGTSVQSSQVVSAVRYSDLQADLQFTIKPGLFLFSTPREIVFGSPGSDSLSGGGKSDQLFGRDGDDQLISSEGADTLVGGLGNDSYVVTSHGSRILDSDGLGTVTFNGVQLVGGSQVGGSVWISADQRFRYYLSNSNEGQQLQIIDTNLSGQALFVEEFTDGDLGITLQGSGSPLPPTDFVAPIDNGDRRDNYFASGNLSHLIDAGPRRDFCQLGAGDDVVLLGGDDDRCLAGLGNDTLHGDDGLDYLSAGPFVGSTADADSDADVLEGGAGTDLLNGGIGDDVLFAETSLDDPNRASDEVQGDLLNGGLGADLLIGSNQNDFLLGGGGADVLQGGSGFDVILGDGDFDFSLPASVIPTGGVPISVAADHDFDGVGWTTSAAPFVYVTPVADFTWATSVSAGDFVFTPDEERPAGAFVRASSGGAADLIDGGPGNDWIAGQAGSDILHGGPGDDWIYGDDLVPLPQGELAGDDFIYGGEGNDQLFGNAGHDFIDGGPGDDHIHGDDEGQSFQDTLVGGPGQDSILGGGGDDVISGGLGDDVLLDGGPGHDVIFGNEGDDSLFGDSSEADAGNDSLFGGAGNDYLAGLAGNDVLHGEAGDDVLEGGSGDDILDGGAGSDLLNGGSGDDSYYFALTESSGANGPDIVADEAGFDRIVFGANIFANRVTAELSGPDLVIQYSPNDTIIVENGAGGGTIEEYEFIDGTILTHSDLFSTSRGIDMATNGNDWLQGTDGPDVIDGLAGDDVIFGLGGDDTLYGGDGDDTIDGVSGSNTIYGGPGNDRLVGGSGDDEVHGEDGDDLVSGGPGDDLVTGGNGNDELHGRDGDDTLQGGPGNDTLNGGKGIDVLSGGPGLDTYIFAPEDDVRSEGIGFSPITVINESTDAPTVLHFVGGIQKRDLQVTKVSAASQYKVEYSIPGSAVSEVIIPFDPLAGELNLLIRFGNNNGADLQIEDFLPNESRTSSVTTGIQESGWASASTTKPDIDSLPIADGPIGLAVVLSCVFITNRVKARVARDHSTN